MGDGKWEGGMSEGGTQATIVSLADSVSQAQGIAAYQAQKRNTTKGKGVDALRGWLGCVWIV